jgi:3-phenylpropionate/cinnamic acid dioxygenase small subunit
MSAIERDLLARGTEVIHRDGMLLDELRWDEWLELYQPECLFWMPMRNEEGQLNEDPQTQLSYIHYQDRKGLEDRVLRVRSRRSPASTPMPRTLHMTGNILFVAPPEEGRMTLRAGWTCHVLFTRVREQHVFFGHSEYELRKDQASWKIARKKIVLLNDDIPTMLDFYCI